MRRDGELAPAQQLKSSSSGGLRFGPPGLLGGTAGAALGSRRRAAIIVALL